MASVMATTSVSAWLTVVNLPSVTDTLTTYEPSSRPCMDASAPSVGPMEK